MMLESVYDGNSFYVAEIYPNTEDISEHFFGIDVPIKGDPVWRFWEEADYKDGTADTWKWKCSDEVKEKIKREVIARGVYIYEDEN